MKSVCRNSQQNGWYIPKALGTRRQRFLDSVYGSREQSYDAALRELEPDADETLHRKIETKARPNKAGDLPVGITHYMVTDGKQIKHRFAVCNPATNKPHILYVGTENTYLRNWEQKRAEAESLREQFIEQYKEQHS